MSEKCDLLHEDFCTAEIEYGVKCPKAVPSSPGSLLMVCTAKPEDLIEVYEECDWCEGPGEDEDHEFPPCPLLFWEACDHPHWKTSPSCTKGDDEK